MSERKVDLTVHQWNIQLDAAWQGGQSYEREAIVAWLRADGGDVCNAYADEIERGEHLRGDDE